MKLSKLQIAALALTGIALAIRNARRFGKLLPYHVVRVDRLGSGYFGAGRKDRTHNGLDLVCTPGETVTAPIAGRITRQFLVYPGDSRYTGFELVNDTYKIKVMYCSLLAGMIGTNVKAGQAVAVCQDVRAKYGAAMKPHLHIEIYKDGQRVDPLPYLL